jgi:hypothetical protein
MKYANRRADQYTTPSCIIYKDHVQILPNHIIQFVMPVTCLKRSKLVQNWPGYVMISKMADSELPLFCFLVKQNTVLFNNHSVR